MKTQKSFCIEYWWLAIALLASLSWGPMVLAQEMPPPRKMPRVPVGRQALTESDKAAIHSRDIKGPAIIIDGEHLRVGDVDLRLFGIVPPQLSASFGPQARTALDDVSRGQEVACHIRDRDHDGHFLATCATVNSKTDLALELLKRGLAVTARGSLQPTEFAVPYAAAEQAAQNQKLGLWSVAPPPPANVPVTPPAAKIENPNVPPLVSEFKKAEKASAPAPVVKSPVAVAPPGSAASTVPAHAEKTPSPLPAPIVIAGIGDEENPGVSGFFARYQLLLTGIVMLLTALGIMLVLAFERRRDRRDEMKAIAAALRGELLAGRAVCLGRLKNWSEADENTAAWPRIRATLYQAYVGRLGWLGAVLSRQIASIYGQAADYAVYFSPSGASMEPREAISKRQALQTLVQHIEEVLPKLAMVEQTGYRPQGSVTSKPPSVMHHQPAVRPAAGVAHEDAAHYAPPVAASPAVSPLWDMVKKFARPRGTQKNYPIVDDPTQDYTSLIEEEMARMSAEEDSAQPSHVTKMRGANG